MAGVERDIAASSDKLARAQEMHAAISDAQAALAVKRSRLDALKGRRATAERALSDADAEMKRLPAAEVAELTKLRSGGKDEFEERARALEAQCNELERGSKESAGKARELRDKSSGYAVRGG